MSAVTSAVEQTTTSIAHIIESFIELGIITHDFEGTENSQEALRVKLNATLQELQQIHDTALIDKIPIPRDVLEYIEDGRNPDVYTREFVEATRKANQHLKGKMLAFKELRDVLGDKIEKEFPELKDVVEDIKRRTDG